MFYKIVALSLVLLGLIYLLSGVSWPLETSDSFLYHSGIGLATIFLGLLNFVYEYETPTSPVPKIVLLGSNILFIGYAILLITSDINKYYAWSVVILSVLNSLMVLNKRV